MIITREILVKETAVGLWLSRGVMVDLYWLESQVGERVVLGMDIIQEFRNLLNGSNTKFLLKENIIGQHWIKPVKTKLTKIYVTSFWQNIKFDFYEMIVLNVQIFKIIWKCYTEKISAFDKLITCLRMDFFFQKLFHKNSLQSNSTISTETI